MCSLLQHQRAYLQASPVLNSSDHGLVPAAGIWRACCRFSRSQAARACSVCSVWRPCRLQLRQGNARLHEMISFTIVQSVQMAGASGSHRFQSGGLHVDLQLMCTCGTVTLCRIISTSSSCALQVSQTRCLRVNSFSSPFQPLRPCSRRRSLHVKVQLGPAQWSQQHRTAYRMFCQQLTGHSARKAAENL